MYINIFYIFYVKLEEKLNAFKWNINDKKDWTWEFQMQNNESKHRPYLFYKN